MTYSKNPPPIFQFVQNYARLLRLYRVYRGIVREAPAINQPHVLPDIRFASCSIPGKSHHTLRQTNLPQLLILLLFQLALSLRIAPTNLGPCLRSFGIVEHNLIMERLVRLPQARIINSEEGQVRRHDLWYCRGRHPWFVVARSRGSMCREEG